MKTRLKKQVLLVLTLASFAALVACSKESENSNTAPTATYTWQNGYCYNNSGQMVQNTYCAQSGNSAYYWMNGSCYNTANQIVNPAYCTNQNAQPGSQQCYGTYYYYTYYGTQQISCNGANCSGYTLYNTQTNQQVFCQ